MSLAQIFMDNPWTTVLVVLLSVLIWMWLQRPRNLPPGPRGWPFVGAASELSDSVHLDFERLGRKYGSEIISIYVGSTLMVSLNSQRTIKEAFVTKGEEFSDRKPANVIKLVNGQDLFFNAMYTPKFKADKKFAVKALRSFGVGSKSMEDKIQHEIDHMTEILLARGGEPIDIQEYLAKAAGNVICSILFSVRYDFDNPESNRVLDISRGFLTALLNAFLYVESVPPIAANILYRHYIKDIRKAFDDMRNFAREHVIHHKATFDPSNLRDFLDVYIKEDNLEEDAFVDTALIFMPDATDSLGLVILWALLFIAHHTEVQKKIQDEIYDVTGGARKVTLQDKANMPYTEATIIESFRRCNTVTMTGYHKARPGATVAGYNIPENALIVANIYAAHMDENVWEDPEVFRPERFLDSSGSVIKTDVVIPFGAGRRMCLGEQLTKVEVFLFVSNLLQKFHFTFPKDRPKPSLEAQQPEMAIRRPVPFEFCLNPR